MTAPINDSGAVPREENQRHSESTEEVSRQPGSMDADNPTGNRRVADAAATPTKEEFMAAILAYSPNDSRPAFAKAREISDCTSDKELLDRPEKWPAVVAELQRLTAETAAQQPTSGEQAYATILKTAQRLALSAEDTKGVAEAKQGIFNQLLGAWDLIEKPLRKLIIKSLWRKIPGKDKPSPGDLMIELEVRRRALRGTEVTPVEPRAVRVRLQDLMLSNNGQPYSNTRNALAAIRQLLPKALHFNEFNQEEMICWPGDSERPWKDTDTTRLQVQLQELGMASLHSGSVEHAVKLIASEHTINPIVEYLHGLQWDKKRRLSIWMREVFGTPTDRYHLRTARNVLIALVARAMQPGCQVDEMIVLEGPQGTFKSSVWRIIGGQYFKELTADHRNKDFEQQLLGVWFGEFAELHTLRRADGARIKQFITNLIDHFRLPWGRRFVDLPRRIVFCGTTNEESDWINDHTGGRRFIPIKVHQPAKLEWLRENRDQLFAEAVHLYRAKRSWWNYPLEEARAQQEMRIAEDPWAESIAAYLCGRQEVTVSEIIERVLNVPVRDRTEGLPMRVGRSLRRLKCARIPVRWVNGESRRSWKVPEEFAKHKVRVAPFATAAEFDRDPDPEPPKPKASRTRTTPPPSDVPTPSPAPAAAAPPQPTSEELRSFDEPPAGNTISSAEPAPSSTPIAPAPQSAAKASGANGKTPEQLLMEQLGAKLEDAAKLVEGKFTTPEKVARASESELLGCGIHRVYAKTLQNAAHNWLRRAAQVRRTTHVS